MRGKVYAHESLGGTWGAFGVGSWMAQAVTGTEDTHYVESVFRSIHGRRAAKMGDGADCEGFVILKSGLTLLICYVS